MIAREELANSTKKWQWNNEKYIHFLYKIQKNGNLLNWNRSEELRTKNYFKTYYSEEDTLTVSDVVEDASNYEFIPDEIEQQPSFPPAGV